MLAEYWPGWWFQLHHTFSGLNCFSVVFGKNADFKECGDRPVIGQRDQVSFSSDQVVERESCNGIDDYNDNKNDRESSVHTLSPHNYNIQGISCLSNIKKVSSKITSSILQPFSSCVTSTPTTNTTNFNISADSIIHRLDLTPSYFLQTYFRHSHRLTHLISWTTSVECNVITPSSLRQHHVITPLSLHHHSVITPLSSTGRMDIFSTSIRPELGCEADLGCS